MSDDAVRVVCNRSVVDARKHRSHKVDAQVIAWPDWINGAFELLAGVAVLHHCWILHRTKRFEGMSVPSTVFFWLWGVWNLFFYPHLGQWISFVGGVSIMLANLLWAVLMFKYRNN